MAFFVGRQNPTGMPADEMERLWALLAEVFEEPWLQATESNVVAERWREQDPRSTFELFALAVSIQKLIGRHRPWIEEKVRLIKSSDAGLVRGALTEIIALGSFVTRTYEVEPASDGNPGFDGIIKTVHGGTLRLSVKNFGSPNAHEAFRRESEETKKVLAQAAKERRLHSIDAAIQALDMHPEPKDWNRLRAGLPGALDKMLNPQAKSGGGDPEALKRRWFLWLRPLLDEEGTLERSMLSYTTNILAPHHKNEFKNLIDKIHEGASNIARHAPESLAEINGVFVRVPWTADLSKVTESVRDYFSAYPDDAVSLVILWQPAITWTE